ncbi:MAG TPA: hypothetical protein ENG87_03180 [Candidatus Pacearchaeota archaeon]|nr:phenylacetate-coenzyme A ligase [archaeon BMS3Abin17]HDK42356.1 hypothetical protein [Candidatus Pacearchaeota archaeon]HDZ60280.1 hypothetical protein [Candidatus Pacearchaeota archaeon]
MKPSEKQIIDYVMKNESCDFYREFYKGVDLSEWKNIPCISKKQIKDYENPGRKFLFVSEDEIAEIKMTTGTTEESLNIYFSKKDVEMRDKKMDLSVRENYPQDARIMSLFPLNFPGRHVEAYKDYVFVEGDIYNLQQAADMVFKLNLNCIRTFPAIALKLGEILERIGYDKIKLIVFAGEGTSDLTKQQLKKYYPNASIRKLSGMTEFSNLGWQCKYFKDTEDYHVVSEEFLKYEILPENGNIEEFGRGELIISSLWGDSAFPLIRYKTGDLVDLRQAECGCGSSKIFTILGRIEFDIIRVGGINILKRNIDQAVSSSGYKDYQVHIYEEIRDDKLYPKLVLKILGEDKGGVDVKLMENLMITPSYNWADGVEKGALLPLEVKFISELEEKGYKTLSVIDHRIKEV